MLGATGIIWTVDKHSIVSTLHGGGGAGEQFVMKFANRPSSFGQDCSYHLIFIIRLIVVILVFPPRAMRASLNKQDQ